MKKKTSIIRQAIIVVIIVAATLFIVLSMLRNYIGTLNTESMSHRSEVCAVQLEDWSRQVMSELMIYKTTAEQFFDDD